MTIWPRFLPALVLLIVPSCGPPPSASRSADRDRITQISVINALMLGQYEGVMPLAEVPRYGDFGVGTLDHLDGELIVLDGEMYQVRGDGQVVRPGLDRSTPFATVTRFDPDETLPCPALDALAALDAYLDETIGSPNAFLAVRVDGRFPSITLRSVGRQEPPYRPLGEVAKDQSVWIHRDLQGTLVGIRCPSWTAGLNVPGYHWHFLGADRRVGGHVLDCQVRDALIRPDLKRDWLVKLDNSPEFDRANLAEDHRRDLDRVESGRGSGTKAGKHAR